MRLGVMVPPIRTALRTGDTSQTDRARIVRRPPHVLITTPESLYLLLTSDKGRGVLAGVETVIVDEIHALVGNKRGAHLALSLERLDALVTSSGQRRPTRIGLSATVQAVDEVAAFLTGVAPDQSGGARPCRLVDAGRKQPLDVLVEVPKEPLSAVASREAWKDVHERLGALINEHKTTLIFVPSTAHVRTGRARSRGAARKRHRRRAPRRARQAHAALRREEAAIGTAARGGGDGVARARHRHRRRRAGVPARLAALDRGLAAAHRPRPSRRRRHAQGAHLRDDARRGRRVRGGGARDGARPNGYGGRSSRGSSRRRSTSCRSSSSRPARRADFGDEALYRLVRGAAPYASLPRAEFDDVVAMLGDGIATRRGRSGAHLHLDRVNKRVRGRRGARIAALTSGGAIPDKADYTRRRGSDRSGRRHARRRLRHRVDGRRHLPARLALVAHPPRRGGRRARRGRGRAAADGAVLERRGPGAHRRSCRARWPSCAPNCSGAAGRTRRWRCSSTTASSSAAPPSRRCGYVVEGAEALGAVPTQTCVVAERFFDDAGGMQLVIHAPFGARINRAWGLALRKKFCRAFDFELQAAASDDAILLVDRAAAQLPARRDLRLRHAGHRRGDAGAGGAAVADVGDALALERDALARGPALYRWQADAAAALAHARRRSDGGGVPRGGRLPGQPRRRDARGHGAARSSARARDHARLPARGDGRRRAQARARARGRRRDPVHGARHGGAVAVGARDLERDAVHVPRRRAARGASLARGQERRAREATSASSTATRSARSSPRRSPIRATPTSCTI